MALPSGTTGSLRPTFVPARPIGLAVKHPYTFTLDARLPTGLRVPLHSSVLELLRRSALACLRGHSRPFLLRSGGYRGPGISAGLYTSPYSTDCIIISRDCSVETFGVQSLRIPRLLLVFPADRPHPSRFHRFAFTHR